MAFPIQPIDFSSEEYDKWMAHHANDQASTDPVVRVAQACFANKVPLVRCLLSRNKIDVNLCNGLAPQVEGAGVVQSTALQHACRHGLLPLVKLLVKAGADVNASNTPTNSVPFLDYPPLEVAYDNNRIKVMRYLIEAGAKVNVLKDKVPLPSRIATQVVYGDPRYFPSALQLLVDHGGDIDCPNENGATPLHLACSKGDRPDLIRFLIFNRANTSSQEMNAAIANGKVHAIFNLAVSIRNQALLELSPVKPLIANSLSLLPLGRDVRNVVHDYLLDVDLLQEAQNKELPATCYKKELNQKPST